MWCLGPVYLFPTICRKAWSYWCQRLLCHQLRWIYQMVVEQLSNLWNSARAKHFPQSILHQRNPSRMVPWEKYHHRWYPKVRPKRYTKGDEGGSWQGGEKHCVLLLRGWKNNAAIVHWQEEEREEKYSCPYNHAQPSEAQRRREKETSCIGFLRPHQRWSRRCRLDICQNVDQDEDKKVDTKCFHIHAWHSTYQCKNHRQGKHSNKATQYLPVHLGTRKIARKKLYSVTPWQPRWTNAFARQVNLQSAGYWTTNRKTSKTRTFEQRTALLPWPGRDQWATRLQSQQR